MIFLIGYEVLYQISIPFKGSGCISNIPPGFSNSINREMLFWKLLKSLIIIIKQLFH